jgi:hypothetical protein
MRSLVRVHTTSLCVMPEVLNRASSVFPDSPIESGNDDYVALLMFSLVTVIPACRESFFKEGCRTSRHDKVCNDTERCAKIKDI